MIVINFMQLLTCHFIITLTLAFVVTDLLKAKNSEGNSNGLIRDLSIRGSPGPKERQRLTLAHCS